MVSCKDEGQGVGGEKMGKKAERGSEASVWGSTWSKGGGFCEAASLGHLDHEKFGSFILCLVTFPSLTEQ